MGALGELRVKRFEAVTADEGEFLGMLGQRMADGEGLREICRGMEISQGRVMEWLMARCAKCYCKPAERVSWFCQEWTSCCGWSNYL